jgi:DNA-binding GntR family transcriptional regulator
MQSLTEKVYRTLRNDILACRLRPGSQLRINGLADELGASLGAVREALSRLAAEGFVQMEIQKGYRVSPVSLGDLADLTRTRIAIEQMCLRYSIVNGGLRWESAIVAAHHLLSGMPEVEDPRDTGYLQDWAAAHEAFHLALVSACGSEWLLKIRTMLFEQADRYRRLSATSTRSSRKIASEHKAIVEAVLGRDPDRASDLIAMHFQRTADIVAKMAKLELEPGAITR